MDMNARDEIHDFLTSRRARITPEQAALPAYGGHRRVAGPRREEVALLARGSVDYYARLERGNARGAFDAVLDALAPVLQLDEAERAYLFDPSRGERHSRGAGAPPPGQTVSPLGRAAHPGRDDHSPGVRAERAVGHPGRLLAQPGVVLADL